MRRELTQSHRELTQTIDRMIKELEEEKNDLELLINIFACKKYIFDRLIRQYFQLWKMKSERDQTLIILPQEERRYLETELGLEERSFEYYEEQIDYAIRRYGELITISKALSLMNNIEKLVIELKMHLNQYNKGAKEALPKIQNILRKKVGRLLFGVALIGADIPLESIPTVIGGIYIIYNAIVIDK